MIVNLNVTKTAIKRGKREDSNACPIARAFKAQGFKNVVVTSYYWYGEKNNLRFGSDLTKKMRKFIEAYDEKRQTKPFKARLNISLY